MRVFLDTEYTDETRRELISVGLVSEDGRREMYLERNDYPRQWCSRFVLAEVLPHLGHDTSAICTLPEFRERLQVWLQELPRAVHFACDSIVDLKLVREVLGGALPQNLAPGHYDLRPLVDTPVYHRAAVAYHGHPQHPWHHALHDARAHRVGWLAWKASGR
jgi:hypothetical protein